MSLLRADGAQQGERASALRDKHLEGVGDHERGDEHGEDAEAHKKYGDDVGAVAAQRFDGLVADILARAQFVVRGQQFLYVVEGFRGDGVAVHGEIEVDGGGVDRVEIVRALHQCDEIVRADDRAAVERVRAFRIGGQAHHAHVVRFGFTAGFGRGVSGRQRHRVADVHAQRFRRLLRQRDFVGILGLAALRYAHRQHRRVGCAGDQFAADVVVVAGDGDGAFRRDAHGFHTFHGFQLVDVEIADGDGIRFVDFLIAEAIDVRGGGIVGATEHGGHLSGERIAHGVAEQEGAGDERRADQDGDAGGDEHALGFTHEFQSDGPHGSSVSFFKYILRKRVLRNASAGVAGGGYGLRGRFALLHQQIVHLLGAWLVDVGHDLPVGEHDGAVRVGGCDGIVGDHDDGLAEFVHGAFEEAQYFRAGHGVEVAGRFVGEHELRLGDERACDGDALLLAAGQFVRTMVQTLLQSKRFDQQVEPLAVRLLAGKGKRHDDVLFGGEHRQQVEALEDEADLVTAQQCQLVIVHTGQVLAIEHDVAAGGRVKAGQSVHQRGFAGAGRSHDGGEPALFEGDVDTAQRVHRVASGPIILDEVDGFDGGVAGFDDVPDVHGSSFLAKLLPKYETIVCGDIMRWFEIGRSPTHP